MDRQKTGNDPFSKQIKDARDKLLGFKTRIKQIEKECKELTGTSCYFSHNKDKDLAAIEDINKDIEALEIPELPAMPEFNGNKTSSANREKELLNKMNFYFEKRHNLIQIQGILSELKEDMGNLKIDINLNYLECEVNRASRETQGLKKEILGMMGIFIAVFSIISVNFSAFSSLKYDGMYELTAVIIMVNLSLLSIVVILMMQIDVMINGRVKTALFINNEKTGFNRMMIMYLIIVISILVFCLFKIDTNNKAEVYNKNKATIHINQPGLPGFFYCDLKMPGKKWRQ